MNNAYIIISDFGYAYQFYLQNPDGSAVDLTGSTVTLRARYSVNPSITVNLSLSITGSPTAGLCTYTVSNGDFTQSGLYYAEVQVAVPAAEQITFQGLSIIVVPKVY